MPGLEIAGLLILGALAWLWLDSLQAREAAVTAARAACEAEACSCSTPPFRSRA